MSVWAAPGWVAALRQTRGSCVARTTRAERIRVDKGLARVEGVVWGMSRQLRECSCWRYAAKQYQLAGALNFFSPTALMKSWKVSWLPHMALFSVSVRRTVTKRTHTHTQGERAKGEASMLTLHASLSGKQAAYKRQRERDKHCVNTEREREGRKGRTPFALWTCNGTSF